MYSAHKNGEAENEVDEATNVDPKNWANWQTMSMERWQTTYGSDEKWGCKRITLVGEQIWTLVGQRVFDHSAEPPCDSWASCLG